MSVIIIIIPDIFTHLFNIISRPTQSADNLSVQVVNTHFVTVEFYGDSNFKANKCSTKK